MEKASQREQKELKENGDWEGDRGEGGENERDYKK